MTKRNRDIPSIAYTDVSNLWNSRWCFVLSPIFRTQKNWKSAGYAAAQGLRAAASWPGHRSGHWGEPGGVEKG